MNKACDLCKQRKLRCSGTPGPCSNCTSHKTECHFSQRKTPRRKGVASQFLVIPRTSPSTASTKPVPRHGLGSQASSSLEATPCSGASTAVQQPAQDLDLNRFVEEEQFPELYVDRLLEKARDYDSLKAVQPLTFKGTGLSANGRLSFFTDAGRLVSLSARLKNNKVNDLVRRISVVIRSRVKPDNPASTMALTRKGEDIIPFTNTELANKWIKLYFEQVSPSAPFLDRESFESTVADPTLVNILRQDRAFSTLYHTILALGCQRDGGGSFEPGKGQAWQLFSVSLALFPSLLSLPDSLTILQALAAMAIFALSISCLSVEHVIVSEGARRAQNLATANLKGEAEVSFQRTFWVLYGLEKMWSFYLERSSGFIDHDIACPVPYVAQPVFTDLDWYLTFATHTRLLSRALTSLFSVGVAGKPPSYYLRTITKLDLSLEDWRLSIPARLQPVTPQKIHIFYQSDPITRPLAVWIHYLYNGFRLTLARAMLQLAAHSDGLVSASQHAESMGQMVDSARSILELTVFVEAEPYTPIWIVAVIPISALFILFDLVIHNPKHPETATNLAMLDIAAGHFSRLEYASAGSLPGSLIAEFAHIAREYVNNVGKSSDRGSGQSQGGSGAVMNVSSWLKTPISPRSSGLETTLETSVATQTPSDRVTEGVERFSLVDPLSFPPPSFEGLPEDIVMGADILDLFNTFIPDIDPMFSQGFS